ncbi:mRNA-decapping enzyme 1B isoform X2 [Limanda limanda]|uniref:mRNA-decapping enzyme 1B isoform X2 n=1 Tax=Limanda limanda TaxID=27771 RepID=UPI0029C7E80A|nr:mRNA-decapping enzyme 1B isoform X2 [Limanda limanda]
MTATSAGSRGCPPAKGLDISLAALQRQDPYINDIVDVASQVALYTYNNRANEWEKTEVEGTLFIYTRLASPRHGFTIMNRLNMENLTEPITKDLDFQLQDPFLLYRNARLVIHGIWFYDKVDCKRIAQRMTILTQQEQTVAQSQGGWPSPAGGGVVIGPGGVTGGGGGGGAGGGGAGGDRREGKGVDILQMLTKARTEYDKVGKDSEAAEPKTLSLATLFGSQPHRSPKQAPVSPVSPAGKVSRPPVARTLTYDDSMNSGRSVTSKGGNAGCSDGGMMAVVREDGGNVVAGLLPSQHQQQQQHCPAIQKLMQGQRGVVGMLQTVSESPENRLCDNGVPLEHHHHHVYPHHHQQQQQHHHHHHHQEQQQLQLDPIKRLFQTQPPSSPSTSFPSVAHPCCSNPPPLMQNPHLMSQPIMVDSGSCSHLQMQQNQQLFFNLSKPQLEAQHNSHSVSTLQGAGLFPSQVTNDNVIQTSQGLSSQMSGVVSPHELLHKLQLVQQEQSLTSSDLPRLGPGLAPRFLGHSPSQSVGPAPNQIPATSGQNAALQFQVISPQRIPATVAPTMLLSPSVFSQTKSNCGLTAVAQENCPVPQARPPLQEEVRVLTRGQIQATLLHLIQSDSSFMDTIYETYISRFANDPSTKYQ